MPKRIGLELRKAQQAIIHRIEKDRQELSLFLTHGQARIISFVRDSDEPVYQKDIEEHLRIRRSTTTEMLNVLERDGYIKRTRAKHDARLKEINVTELSYKVIDEMTQYFDCLEDIIEKGIDQKDKDVFFKVLNQIKKNMETR